mmetsp:Transcript_14964/g.44689  ORF Transcript_14964/g.44689 Transcript_14964/m.44689 type:complete len:176 (-) Transcript_14964:45-572(-)
MLRAASALVFMRLCAALAPPPRAQGGLHRCPSGGRPRSLPDDAVYAGSESLKAVFERALVQQRMGDTEGALAEYEAFVDAAEQNDIPPRLYAEVLENIGACHLKLGDRKTAIRSWERALGVRDSPTARCNLAIAFLQSGRIDDARVHAEAATAGGDERAAELAARILADIDGLRR